MAAHIPRASKSSTLSTPDRVIWKIDEWSCAPGDQFQIRFLSKQGPWRHGVWLGVEGELEINEVRSAQFVIWEDTSPEQVEVRVVTSRDGMLRLYNVWDSGRQLGDHESQSASSGMVREDVASIVRYRCSSIAKEPDFEDLVFTMTRT